MGPLQIAKLNNMNNLFIWLAVAVVALGGGYFFLSGTGTPVADDTMMEEGEMMENDDAMSGDNMMGDGTMEDGEDAMMDAGDNMMEGDGAMMEKGSYEVYSADKLARADSGNVVLFFRATWCPTCKALDANIRANASSIPAGLSILDVDYDNSEALKKKYGVTYQHTMVQVNSDGSMIKKWSGSPTLAALTAEVK